MLKINIIDSILNVASQLFFNDCLLTNKDKKSKKIFIYSANQLI